MDCWLTNVQNCRVLSLSDLSSCWTVDTFEWNDGYGCNINCRCIIFSVCCGFDNGYCITIGHRRKSEHPLTRQCLNQWWSDDGLLVTTNGAPVSITSSKSDAWTDGWLVTLLGTLVELLVGTKNKVSKDDGVGAGTAVGSIVGSKVSAAIQIPLRSQADVVTVRFLWVLWRPYCGFGETEGMAMGNNIMTSMRADASVALSSVEIFDTSFVAFGAKKDYACQIEFCEKLLA